MFQSAIGWLDSKPFAQQILILALICDPIGFTTGYLLAPAVDVDPLMGAVYGLVAASIPVSMWVTRYAQANAKSKESQ